MLDVKGAGFAAIDDGDMRHFGRNFDDADDIGDQVAVAGVVIDIEGALGVFIAWDDAVEVVDQFLTVLDE